MRAFASALVALPLGLVLSFGLAGTSGPLAFAQAPAPAVVAAPAAGDLFNLVASDSKLGYFVVHPLHKVNGQSKVLSGKARITAAGQAQVSLTVAADSFDSGNVQRDAHVKEVIEAARYPKVELKAVADGITMPTTFPSTIEKPFKVQVNFHGVQQAIDVPVKVTFESATRVRAQCSFVLSLEAFKIERPSLMFKKVSDELKIGADLVLGK